jgi:tetratricopeptide (TPR) repeat protein
MNQLRPLYKIPRRYRLVFYYIACLALGIISGLGQMGTLPLVILIVLAGIVVLLPDTLGLCSSYMTMRGKLEQSCSLCRMALELEPGNHLAMLNLGYANFRAGRFSEAKQCFDRCIEQKPKQSLSYINRSASHLRLCDYEAADADASKAMALNKRDVRGNINRIVSLMGRCRHLEALQELEKISGSKLFKDFVTYNKLVCRLRLSHMPQAELDWQRSGCKHKVLSRAGEAWLAWEKEEFARVLELTASVRDDSLDAEIFLFLRSIAYSAMGELDLAYAIAMQMIAAKPQATTGLEALLVAFTRAGLEDRAIEIARRLEDRNPHHFDVNISRATLALRRGDLPTAKSEITAAMEKCPTNSTARALSSIILTRAGEDTLSLAQKNAAENPHKTLSWLALGEAQLAGGNAEALSNIKKAAEMNRYSPMLLDHLAGAYRALGHEAEAKQAEMKAAELHKQYTCAIERAMRDQPLYLLEDFLAEAEQLRPS